MISAKVLEDSISDPGGVRLTTIEGVCPRFILAELNTHRMLSRNSASSRAIPPERIIDEVVKNPFIPHTFNKRVKGMGVGDQLTSRAQRKSIVAWLDARDGAVSAAQRLIDLDVDKSRVNRLLEPFMWHTVIITATDWDNFFALRCHPAAQPEMQEFAWAIREAMWNSEPVGRGRGEWHLPGVNESERDEHTNLVLAGASAGRMAKVSYVTHNKLEHLDDSVQRCLGLTTNGHWSPTEHPATPAEEGPDFYHGNFRGWKQLRKFYANEDNFGRLLEEVGAA